MELLEGKACNKNIEAASGKSAVKTCLDVKLKASVDGNDVSNTVIAMVAYKRGGNFTRAFQKMRSKSKLTKKEPVIASNLLRKMVKDVKTEFTNNINLDWVSKEAKIFYKVLGA